MYIQRSCQFQTYERDKESVASVNTADPFLGPQRPFGRFLQHLTRVRRFVVFSENPLIMFIQIVRKSGPVLPKEDEPRGIIAPLKENLASFLETISPANILKWVKFIEIIGDADPDPTPNADPKI